MAEQIVAAATSTAQADDAFLAACSALLLSIATDTMLADAETDALVTAMPDWCLQWQLKRGLLRRKLAEAAL